MDQVVLWAGLAFAINKTVSVVKALASRDWNASLTQLVVWVVGFVGLSLAAHADVTSGWLLPGLEVQLSSLDGSSLVLLAWVLGASGSFAYDVKKALDGTDSAAEPRLLPLSGTPPEV